MFTVSKALLISRATVIMRLWSDFLKPVLCVDVLCVMYEKRLFSRNWQLLREVRWACIRCPCLCIC